jgi:hypothetical protein
MIVSHQSWTVMSTDANTAFAAGRWMMRAKPLCIDVPDAIQHWFEQKGLGKLLKSADGLAYALPCRFLIFCEVLLGGGSATIGALPEHRHPVDGRLDKGNT